jgi:hypothetical protein
MIQAITISVFAREAKAGMDNPEEIDKDDEAEAGSSDEVSENKGTLILEGEKQKILLLKTMQAMVFQ